MLSCRSRYWEFLMANCLAFADATPESLLHGHYAALQPCRTLYSMSEPMMEMINAQGECSASFS